jgi:MFS family permease
VLEGKEAIIPSLWLSLWAASGPMGQMAGSLIGGWLQDVIGRRRNIFVFTLFEIGTIFMSYFADRLSTPEGRRSLYFAGKLLEGAAMGSVIGTANTYISENFPLNLRASILSLPTIYTLLGEFIGALIIQSRVMILNEESYRLPIAAQWAFSVIPLVAVLTLPESPVWLMRQDKWEQAQKACSRLEGGDGSSWFSRLKLDLEEERNETGQREETSYLDCFRRRANARRTGIVIFANLLTELFGLPLLGHSTYLLELAGMSSSDAYDGFISGCVVGVVANLGAFWMVPRFGRRSLTFSTLACITILWLTVGISACFKASSAFWYANLPIIST